MPVSRTRQALGLVVVAAALLWVAAGDRIQAAMTPDSGGCAQSSDLPQRGELPETREAVLCLVNRARAERGLAPLRADRRLQRSAQAHARDMAERDFFAHEDPDGGEPDDRIRTAGYDGRTTGENLAWGTEIEATPARIVERWMESPGHRANILEKSFTRVGTGVAHDPPERAVTGPAGVYVQNFGG